MKKCNNCGTEMLKEERFCSNCGAENPVELEDTDEKETAELISEGRNCKNCGEELEEGAVFCSNCGTDNSSPTEKTNKSLIDTTSVKEQAKKTYEKTMSSIESSGYLNYIKKTLKNPSVFLKDEAETYVWYQLAGISLMTLMTMFLYIKGIGSLLSAPINSLGEFGAPMLSEFQYGVNMMTGIMLPRVMLGIIILYASFFGVTFIVNKFLTPKEKSFMEMATELSGLLTPSIILFLIGSIFSLFLFMNINSSKLVVLFIFLGFQAFFVAFIYYLNQMQLKSRPDKFYVLLISKVVIYFIYMSFIFYQFRSVIMELISTAIRYGF